MSKHRQPSDALGVPLIPPMAQAAGRIPRAVLVAGSIYYGTVTKRAEDGTYEVSLDEPRRTVTGARLALPVVGGLTGFAIKTILPIGTKVAMVWDTTPFVFGILPDTEPDWLNAATRTMLWGVEAKAGKSKAKDVQPADMVAGEFEISNGFGVAVAFLTTLCRMTAGGRSAVEMCLIDDMLRLVSSQFRHISALGDELIFDHGRPTLERSWSSYRHEVMNQLKAGDPLAKMKGDDLDRGDAMDQRVQSVGRSRYLEFVGFVGDFVHKFVCDPVSTLASIATSTDSAGDAKVAGSGKSWQHVGSDGTLLWQSVSDIRMEVVTRIPVPARVVSHVAKDLAAKRDYDNLNNEYLRMFPSGGPDGKSMYRSAYQIRLYARWLSRLHAVARFLQLSDEYRVPVESDVPAPDPNCAEEDRSTANPDVATMETYACMTIMRNGAVMLHSGCGSTVMLADGNVQISASRHLHLEAAGSISLIAGDSINMRAQRSVEITAETGGIMLYARAWLKGIVTKGSLWLRSCANFLTPETPDESMPAPEIAGEPGKRAAIMLEATGGNIISRSEMGFAVFVDGKPDDISDPYADTTYGIVMATPSNVKVSGRNVITSADGDIVSAATKATAISTPVLYGSVREISLPGFNMQAGHVRATTVAALSMAANSMFNGKVGPLTDPDDPASDVGQHLNHVGVLDSPVPAVAAGTDLSGVSALVLASGSSIRARLSPWTSSSDGPRFSFPPASEYYWDTRSEEAGVDPQTVTQQYLTLDVSADPWEGPGYGSWTMSAFSIPGPRVGLTAGFGTGRRLFVTERGEALRVPSDKSHADRMTATSQADWISKSGVAFRFLKRH